MYQQAAEITLRLSDVSRSQILTLIQSHRCRTHDQAVTSYHHLDEQLASDNLAILDELSCLAS